MIRVPHNSTQTFQMLVLFWSPPVRWWAPSEASTPTSWFSQTVVGPSCLVMEIATIDIPFIPLRHLQHMIFAKNWTHPPPIPPANPSIQQCTWWHIPWTWSEFSVSCNQDAAVPSPSTYKSAPIIHSETGLRPNQPSSRTQTLTKSLHCYPI